MLNSPLVATVSQRILAFLAKFSDREFYERQLARIVGVSYGAANRALNELYSAGAVRRRQEGKMLFYSIDLSNVGIIEYKKLITLMLVAPLTESLKAVSSKVVLYGSCAQGTDTSASDLDLFIVASDKKLVTEAIDSFKFPKEFEEIHIQAVIKSPVEMLEAGEEEQAFLKEVERGIVLWERTADESRV